MLHPHPHLLVHTSGPFKGHTNMELLPRLSVTRADLSTAVTTCTLPPFNHYNRLDSSYPPSLGQLDRFPLHIIQEIFLDVDIATLIWSCRGLSSQAQTVVDTLLPFRRICKYAGEAVAALLATGSARFFTTREVYALLVGPPGCWTCGEFGGFMFMPQGVRCCMFCLLTRLEFMPLTKHGAIQGYGMTESQFWRAGLPVVRPLNGRYGVESHVMIVKKSHVSMLVSRVKAREVAAGYLMPAWLAAADQEINERIVLRTSKKAKSMPEDPRMITAERHLWRLQCAVPFPFLQVITTMKTSRSLSLPTLASVLVKVQRGVSCCGCKAASESLKEGNSPTGDRTWGVQLDLRMFTEESFMEHMQDCSAVQQLWLRQVKTAVY